jgi:homoserine O-succinyltransferase/O-acetyltransferase
MIRGREAGLPDGPGDSSMTTSLDQELHSGPLRVGIVNIMPRAENYEPYLVRPLSRSALPVSVVWIRLESHTYSSSDQDHILQDYRTYEQATANLPLDGLILTGAPVEELQYHQVTYWSELTQILAHARDNVHGTLGLCWGAMALAKQLEIDKRTLPRKLFGVFENRNLAPDDGLLAGADDRFWCAHSRHSGIGDSALEHARDAGLVRLLSHASDTGYSLFETPGHRYVMHLGHPEYEPSRLIEEWRRDASLGRTDVAAPENFDVHAPINRWRSHCTGLFSRWLSFLHAARHESVNRRAAAQRARSVPSKDWLIPG